MRDAPGPLIVDVAGHALDGDDREILKHPLVGGVILFTRNFADRAQLRALCDELHALRPGCPHLVTVDHEGGRVQRFREGFTALPPAATYGETWRTDRDQAQDAAATHGRTLASELLAAGVDLSFAPVADLGRGLGSVIGDRALGDDPASVATLVAGWISGMHAAGMAACVKHYPGHGGVAEDSHHELPVDARTLADLSREDLVPFTRAFAVGVESVMMAHVEYPQVDARPASLSPVWIRERLRKHDGFDGAVICDDLSMAGAAGFGTYPDRARAALDAGCDALPVCNNRAGVIEILDALPAVVGADSARRIARLRPGPRR